ncbi:MAG: DUF1570 domain-containing protein [Planctomycetia bacterium]|nr:DUF1570 domain-containing protein [Planctomycetia bacterium]
MSRSALMCAAVAVCVGGCASWRTSPSLPSAVNVNVGQLIVHADFDLAADNRLLAELEALRPRVAAELQLPASTLPVDVYLFQTQRTYRAFLHKHFPTLPNRRAFFIESESQLAVYAQWGDRAAEDLRHETSHAYLHGMAPQLPLWVDEGLAEYFEVQPDEHGLNRPHVDRLLALMRQGRWQPDVVRLARLDSLEQMNQTDYAEAWTWIHWLLHSTPENRGLLLGYLAALHDHRHPLPLESVVLERHHDANRELVEHLQQIDGGARK